MSFREHIPTTQRVVNRDWWVDLFQQSEQVLNRIRANYFKPSPTTKIERASRVHGSAPWQLPYNQRNALSPFPLAPAGGMRTAYHEAEAPGHLKFFRLAADFAVFTPGCGLAAQAFVGGVPVGDVLNIDNATLIDEQDLSGVAAGAYVAGHIISVRVNPTGGAYGLDPVQWSTLLTGAEELVKLTP